MKKGTFIGIVDMTRNGTGFVAHEDLDEDILISPNLINTALHGDEVEVLILPKALKGRANGKVLKVLKRARTRFVGSLQKENGKWYLVPDSKRMHVDIQIAKSSRTYKSNLKIRTGEKAFVEMCEWNDAGTPPKGEILKILGKAGEHETEMQAVLLERDFEDEFPTAVGKEAEQIQSKWPSMLLGHSGREDFRDVLTFTIDPADAKDFDDALSIRKISSGRYEVGIHIADVTHFVILGTKLDEEARKRGTSVYLVDRTIPMLPEELSNDICSLKEGVERFAFSVIFELDKNAKVQSARFAKTIIKSDKRLSYRDAQDLLDRQEPPSDSLGGSWRVRGALVMLRDLASKLRNKRAKAGAIDFDTNEVGFKLDENKKVIDIFVKERLETMKMIEDFMLLTNEYVASHLSGQIKDKKTLEKMFIYRIHTEPDANKIEDLRIFLRALGYDSLETGTKQIQSKDLAKLMQEVRGKPEQAVIQMATLRAMAKAVYSHKNIGHFSLGFKHYTHFTSPIRRYPDIIAHRILKAHLDNTAISKRELDSYKKAAILSSEREVEAVAAERDSIKFKQIEYMKEYKGESFNGTITGVSKKGLFITEDKTKSEGFVSVSSIKDDWYELDEKNYCLVARQNKRKFRIGDKAKIKLIKASVEDKQLDWEIVQ